MFEASCPERKVLGNITQTLTDDFTDVETGTIIVVEGFCCEMQDFQYQYQTDDMAVVNMMIRKLQGDFDKKGFNACKAKSLRFALLELLRNPCDNDTEETITCPFV